MNQNNHSQTHLNKKSSNTHTEASQQSYDLENLPNYLKKYFQRINQNTQQRQKKLPIKQRNFPSITELTKQKWPENIIILSRGPSFFRHDYLTPILQAKKQRKDIAIIAVDGCLAHCLKTGLIPDLTCTVDPHEYRILRWFGDKQGLSDKDDYFKLDRDTPKNPKAIMPREEIINLTNQYGPQLKVACGIYTSDLVIQRLQEIGAKIYQFIPMSEDSEELVKQLKLPAIYTGGNVGTTAYSIAVSILKAKRIALAGFDFSYPPDTPLEQTQYYDVLQTINDKTLAEKFFIKIKNPHLNETWFTDLVYLMYADEFLWITKIAEQQGTETYNCTQGGIITGDPIKWTTLQQFLEKIPTKQQNT